MRDDVPALLIAHLAARMPALMRPSQDPPVAAARRSRLPACSTIPPATPTPSTYIQPSWKSKMWELNSEVKIFCTTTSNPIQFAQALAAEQQQMRQPHRIEHDDRRARPTAPRHSASGYADCRSPPPRRRSGRWRPARTARASIRCHGRTAAPRQKTAATFPRIRAAGPIEVGMFCSL